ncbi:hypothetical protein OG828_44810 [Streptomyces sp. NBC_00457]|uniref:hypothetical protein n=1 Tax=Streptomyces sp. NBC_00457 TaxID=2975748 RepID=UPI002E1AB810
MAESPSRAELAAYMEELAVYGRAVERGVIPLAYAVDALLTQPFPARLRSRSPHCTVAEQVAGDLRQWEQRIIEWGLSAERIDQECWDLPADAWLREHLKRACRGRGMQVDDDTDTGGLLREYVRHLLEGGGRPPTG